MDRRRNVFVTGGTGYLGRPLITALLERGHTVRALIREESRNKLPPGCLAIPGNALDGNSMLPRSGQRILLCNWLEWLTPVGESRSVPQRGHGFGECSNPGGERSRDQTLRLSERGAAGTDDEGVRRGQSRMRSQDSPERLKLDGAPSLVRARSGTPLALCAPADVLAARAASLDPGRRPPFGPGYARTNEASARRGRRESVPGNPRP